MNDCLIATKEGEDALYQEITIAFFDILQNNFLFLKPSKCLFEQTEIDFLSLQLTLTSITIDPAKVSTIKDWPRIP